MGNSDQTSFKVALSNPLFEFFWLKMFCFGAANKGK
jgi:hypothetical protein